MVSFSYRARNFCIFYRGGYDEHLIQMCVLQVFHGPSSTQLKHINVEQISDFVISITASSIAGRYSRLWAVFWDEVTPLSQRTQQTERMFCNTCNTLTKHLLRLRYSTPRIESWDDDDPVRHAHTVFSLVLRRLRGGDPQEAMGV